MRLRAEPMVAAAKPTGEERPITEWLLPSL